MREHDFFKEREKSFRSFTDDRPLTVIRLDGRAFHTFTKGLDIPFDSNFMNAMDATAIALCKETSALMAYVQSDEISLVLKNKDEKRPEFQSWFSGSIQKMVSVSAALAAVKFNSFHDWGDRDAGLFDSRVFTLDSMELLSYINWRRRDCVKNSVSMAAYAHFPSNEMMSLDTAGRKEALDRIDKPWDKLPDRFKFGRYIRKEQSPEPVTYIHKGTGEENTVMAMRSHWTTQPALEKFRGL